MASVYAESKNMQVSNAIAIHQTQKTPGGRSKFMGGTSAEKRLLPKQSFYFLASTVRIDVAVIPVAIDFNLSLHESALWR